MTEILKSFAEMENGGFVLTVIVFFICLTVFLVLTYLFKSVAVIFRGWPPVSVEITRDADDDDDNPSGTFRTSETRTPCP